MADGFFDYAIADEVHELKGDTAQGNALGTLAACARHIAVLTGTLLGGYADELFNILFRLGPSQMLEEGFEYGEAGIRAFTEIYGLLEQITVIEPADNACSEARVTKRVRHRPGASPLLFGRFLMGLGAFVSLEDISDALPPYQEDVVSVEMDPPLKEAYEDLEQDIKEALREHRGNQSVISVALNALLAYPDRPYGFGNLMGREFNPETQRREPFLISATRDLDESFVYAKERTLLGEIKTSLERGRRVQVYAVYTQKRDVTRRLEQILDREGIRVAVLTTEVTPELREAWYERQLRAGVQVVIGHPRLVQTGLDLWSFPDIFFYETGYSIYTLRQASRRSWRIGQRSNVNVKFFYYAGTMQEACMRLMGKKLLVSLAMEGKFASDGLQAIDEGDDILMAMARELVTEKGIGENAAAVWKELQRQQAETFGVRPVESQTADADSRRRDPNGGARAGLVPEDCNARCEGRHDALRALLYPEKGTGRARRGRLRHMPHARDGRRDHPKGGAGELPVRSQSGLRISGQRCQRERPGTGPERRARERALSLRGAVAEARSAGGSRSDVRERHRCPSQCDSSRRNGAPSL